MDPFSTYLVEEDLSLTQDVLQLGQLQEVALQRFGVLVHLAQFVLQLLEGGLQVDHLPRLGSFGALAGVQHRDAVLLDFLLQVAQLALHLVAPAHLVDELALERIDVRVELHGKRNHD